MAAFGICQKVAMKLPASAVLWPQGLKQKSSGPQTADLGGFMATFQCLLLNNVNIRVLDVISSFEILIGVSQSLSYKTVMQGNKGNPGNQRYSSISKVIKVIKIIHRTLMN